MTFSAGEVLKQLGGNRFIAMTGAKNFVKDDKKQLIGFKVPKAKDGIKYVRITLNEMDTYDVEFLTANMKLVEKVEGVYIEQLQDIFTEKTGLDTHL